MTAGEQRRRWVLQAMGLTLWESRAGAPAPAPQPAPPPEVQPEVQPEPAADPDASAGSDWETLEAEVGACQRCGLHAGRSNPVFGVGARDARWMIVGEAPGAEEDRRGEPFVGRAGKLLDAMLAAVGLDRSTVFIANILKSRPPDNRDPSPDEIAACRPYLERQIELVQPSLILAVGRVAAQVLLASDQPLGRMRGSVHAYGQAAIPLVVTYHPAYLLRKPSEKHKSWEDLCLALRTADAGLK